MRSGALGSKRKRRFSYAPLKFVSANAGAGQTYEKNQVAQHLAPSSLGRHFRMDLGFIFMIVKRSREVVNQLVGFIPANAIKLLELASQLFATSVHNIELVVGKLSPLLAHFTFQLFPVTFNTIPIHGSGKLLRKCY